jgi:uncharacterized protein YcfJ
MKKTISLFSILILSSCAGYSPVVDPQSISNHAKYDRDVAECREVAKSNTDTGKSVAKHGIIGGAIGTGTGALLGLIGGNTVRGLATGAVIGGVAGGVTGGYEGEREYEAIFRNCMRGRGYNVLN